MWTLTDPLGKETSLGDLGIYNATFNRISQASDVLTFDMTVAIDHPIPWDYASILTFKRDRDPVIVQGVTVSYTGGSIYFVGRVTVPPRRASPESETLSYQLAGPWWYFDNLIYQQAWFLKVDPARPDYSQVGGYQSHVLLNQGVNGARLNTDWQIWSAVNWAQSAGAPLIIPTTQNYAIPNPGNPGQTVDIPGPDASAQLPSVQVPFDEARDITCAEVIRREIRWAPDSISWFDYSTNPPTFHCERRSTMDSYILDLVDKDIFTSEISLAPREDIKVPCVCLKFERTFDFSGTSIQTVDIRVYPDNGLDPIANAVQYAQLASQYQLTFQALNSTISLLGGSSTSLSGTIRCQAINADNPNEAIRNAWWKTKVAWLNNAQISQIHITDWAFTQADGTPLATFLTNELLEGQIADWMGYQYQQITITAKIAYQVIDENGNPINVFKSELLVVNTVSTDAPIGVSSKTTIGSATTPESIPEGLAKEFYLSTNTTQWEGTVTIVERELTSKVRPGMKLNIAGGDPRWLTMDALVQQVTENIDTGTTSIVLGPASHLGPADLIELHRINRLRFTFTNPATRTTGLSGAGGSGSLGNVNADTNTDGSAQLFTKLKMINAQRIIDIDALAGQVLIGSGNDANGVNKQGLLVIGDLGYIPSSPTVVPPGAKSAIIANPDDLRTDGKERVSFHQKIRLCINGDPNWQAWIQMTTPEPYTP